jgi:hypothetical protein
MAKMTVHMLGIMYFDVCHTNSPTITLPDGTRGDGGLPPHFASLFVERGRYDWDDWPWDVVVREVPLLTMRSETVTIPVLEFRIPVFSQVDFPPDASGSVNIGDLPQGLQSLREADPNFNPDLSGKGAVAQVRIGSGQFHACQFNGATAVQWTIESGNQPLGISATSTDQHGITQTGNVFLKPQPSNAFGAEVVFANMPDFLTGIVASTKGHSHGASGHDHAGHHFSLYGKIDKNHGSPQFPPHHSDLEHHCGVMSAFGYADILASCGAGCC